MFASKKLPIAHNIYEDKRKTSDLFIRVDFFFIAARGAMQDAFDYSLVKSYAKSSILYTLSYCYIKRAITRRERARSRSQALIAIIASLSLAPALAYCLSLGDRCVSPVSALAKI